MCQFISHSVCVTYEGIYSTPPTRGKACRQLNKQSPHPITRNVTEPQNPRFLQLLFTALSAVQLNSSCCHLSLSRFVPPPRTGLKPSYITIPDADLDPRKQQPLSEGARERLTQLCAVKLNAALSESIEKRSARHASASCAPRSSCC